MQLKEGLAAYTASYRKSVLQRHPAVHWHPCSLEPPAMNTGWNDSLSKQAVQDLLGTCIASNAASNGR
eukprot:1158815-Pelagomonas_calceolata.AAC.5